VRVSSFEGSEALKLVPNALLVPGEGISKIDEKYLVEHSEDRVQKLLCKSWKCSWWAATDIKSADSVEGADETSTNVSALSVNESSCFGCT
jgi:hypothetical protein